MRGFSARRNTEGEALSIAPRPQGEISEEDKDIQTSIRINPQSSRKKKINQTSF